MSTHTLTIGCKVNLYLEIIGRRPDGYHELRTVFYPLPAPGDTLTLEPTPEARGLALTTSDPALATPGNLVAKAYEAFARATGFRPGLAARLDKGIPSGAGLGGGSADCAAMLAWLNGQAGPRSLPPERLHALAAGLGADVPFFLLGRPALATGVGDVLEPVDMDLADLSVVVAVPADRVSTAWAYAAWDRRLEDSAEKAWPSPLTSLPGAAKRSFCISGLFVANAFEAVVFPAFPAIRVLKERLLGLGAAGAAMSGSGSAVFGLFRDPDQAQHAATLLSGPGMSVHVCAMGQAGSGVRP